MKQKINSDTTVSTPLKKGENDYQKATLVAEDSENPLAIHTFKELNDKPVGYNTLCHIDRLLHTVRRVATGLTKNSYAEGGVPYIAVGAKHGNPCGASTGNKKQQVLEKMCIGDPQAIFGGDVMTSFEIGVDEATTLLEYGMATGKKRMLKNITAPSFTPEAIAYLTADSKSLLFANTALGTTAICSESTEMRRRQVEGGTLMQDPYSFILDTSRMSITETLTDEQKIDLILAWGVGSTSNSNTSTLVHDKMLIGNGVGQQARVGSCELAIKKARDAGHEGLLTGAVAYSDSYFPFTDGPEVLIQAGIQVILATSGSKNDEKVIEHCNNAGITLCLISDKEGRGFFAH